MHLCNDLVVDGDAAIEHRLQVVEHLSKPPFEALQRLHGGTQHQIMSHKSASHTLERITNSREGERSALRMHCHQMVRVWTCSGACSGWRMSPHQRAKTAMPWATNSTPRAQPVSDPMRISSRKQAAEGQAGTGARRRTEHHPPCTAHRTPPLPTQTMARGNVQSDRGG